jgi:hypothetical protein
VEARLGKVTLEVAWKEIKSNKIYQRTDATIEELLKNQPNPIVIGEEITLTCRGGKLPFADAITAASDWSQDVLAFPGDKIAFVSCRLNTVGEMNVLMRYFPRTQVEQWANHDVGQIKLAAKWNLEAKGRWAAKMPRLLP